MKKICVYGVGAIGGLMAGRLARAGYEVSAIARGETLAQLQSQSLQIEAADGAYSARIRASAQPADLGHQDLVIISVKTTALDSVASAIAPLIGPHTVVLSAMNGIPWWFEQGLPASAPPLNLSRLDPTGAIAAAIPAQQIIGCVTHLSAITLGPAHVNHIAGNKLILGEAAGGDSLRLQALARTMRDAGFDCDIAPSIQQEIWFKLWGNMTMNPVSFITSATGDRILADPFVRDFLSRCMVEASLVGDQIGLHIASTPEARHQVTEKLGAFKTSMLQDLEARKCIELDALVAIVIDMAEQFNLAAPNLQTLYGLTRLKAQQIKLY
jgi:2-dehydropantoate 2-reductase